MQFGIAESMCDIDHYLPIAQAADEAGFGVFARTLGLAEELVEEEEEEDTFDWDDPVASLKEEGDDEEGEEGEGDEDEDEQA